MLLLAISYPTNDDFRLQIPTREAPKSGPSDEIISLAENAVSVLPDVPLYSRIDIMYDDTNKRYLVSEVELIEPRLLFYLHPAATETFSKAIMRRLNVT